MVIGFVSDSPSLPPANAARGDWIRHLRNLAAALEQHGVHVQWVSSTDTATALMDEASLISLGVEGLPTICRHLLPCQVYDLNGSRLFCLDPALWQEPALHTRLFTFLCLLQQTQPCTAWHAWGNLSSAYTTVYTARFLSLAAVVSHLMPTPEAGSPDAFRWQWATRHASHVVVGSRADQEQLLATTVRSPAGVSVIPWEAPESVSQLLTLYRNLQAA